MSVKNQREITHQQADALVYSPFEIILEFDSDDSSANVEYKPLPGNLLVYGAVVRVTETLAGGTPALLVGDSTADDTWVVSGDTAETAGDIVIEMDPVYYATPNYVKATWQASHSAGKFEIRLLCSGKQAADPNWKKIQEIVAVTP